MEQERQNREAEGTEFQSPNIPILCSNNCGFFGSSATNNLCSKCYKDAYLSKSKASVEAAIVTLPTIETSKAEEKSTGDNGDDGGAKDCILRDVGNPSGESSLKKYANRCSFCNKRVGLMGFKCRCGDVFCSVHRYSDKHGCAFDYRGTGQDAIAKANPVVKADKVDKI